MAQFATSHERREPLLSWLLIHFDNQPLLKGMSENFDNNF